jgi:hypothetical protein
LRALNGRSITPRESVRLWRAFFWRFVLLGLVVAVPLVIYIAVVRPDPTPPRFLITISLFSVVVDLALTFVTQALAFTTRRVREALRIGLWMIRSEWPKCVLYVLAPPLALQVVLGLRLAASSHAVGFRAISGVGIVLGLAFKGATALFYLRRHPSRDDGSAWKEEQLSLAPPVPMPPPPNSSKGSKPLVRGRRPNVPESRRRRHRPPS